VAAFIAVKVSFITSDSHLASKSQKENRDASSIEFNNHNYTLRTTPDKKTIYTSMGEAHFKGKVNLLSASISIDDQPVSIDEKGQFDVVLSMQPGENKFVFAYEDSQQGKREERVFRWIMDAVEPAFQLTKPLAGVDIPLSMSEVNIVGEFILFDEKSKVEEGVNVEVNGTPLTISDNRRGFSGAIQLADGQHELNVTATDRAGNTAMKSLSVEVDTTSPIISIEGYKVAHEEGRAPLVRFSGTVSEPSMLSFGQRPVAIDEKGRFQFEIYSADLAIMQQKGKVMFQAKDRVGNTGSSDLPKDGDFVPPRWLELELVDGVGAGSTLVGKVSEANVKVRIGSAEAVADTEGTLRIEKVAFDQANPVVETVLRDEAGNESHIQQWVSIHSKGK